MSDIICILSSDEETTDDKTDETANQYKTTEDLYDISSILKKYGIPQSPKHSSNDKLTKSPYDDMSSIAKKYKILDSPETEVRKGYNDISSSDDELSTSKNDDMSSILKKYGISNSPKNEEPTTSNDNDFPECKTASVVKNKELATKQRKRKSSDKEKMRKEQEKIAKREERERIKAENAASKAKKQALAAAYKNLKPEECLKAITVVLDSNLISSSFGFEIPTILTTAGINYKLTNQILPNSVTWTQPTQSQLTQIEGHLGLSTEKNDCQELIFITSWDEIVRHVCEKSLCEYFVRKQSLVPDKKITLGIYGLQDYFRFFKSRNNDRKLNKKDEIYLGVPKVNRKDVDIALAEIQILTGCSHRMLETAHDVGHMIAQFSKSISQVPYKLEKNARQNQMDWYVSGCNKDSVRVDKSGNGLASLWRQQLTQFSLARLETAEAVCSLYPNPSALIEAYDRCVTQKEAEGLLKDIPIRRAAGPLSTNRKLGPELSKKICTVFTSLDGQTIV